MVAKSKHFEMEDVDWGDAYHSRGMSLPHTFF